MLLVEQRVPRTSSVGTGGSPTRSIFFGIADTGASVPGKALGYAGRPSPLPNPSPLPIKHHAVGQDRLRSRRFQLDRVPTLPYLRHRRR